MNRLIAIALLLVPALPVLANDYLQFDSFADVDLGSWAGAGALVAEQVVCIASANTDRPNPPPNVGGQQAPYYVRVENIDTPGTFALFLNSNPGQAADGRIDAEIWHQDLLSDAGGLHALAPGIIETVLHAGQYKNCTDGLNARFRFELSASSIIGKRSGTYVGDFAITVTGGASGSLAVTRYFRISVDVIGSQRVRISGLDNVSFGSSTGAAAATMVESFCVYSDTGAYRLTAASADQGADGRHFLAHNISPDLIPVAVSFDDGSGARALTNNAVSATTAAMMSDCTGLTNASLSFTIDAPRLQAAPAGQYGQTLILTVAPE